jgi:hypothetical protein
VMSTIATLLVLPSLFAVVIGGRVARSPSIYPDDRESAHYDPDTYADQIQPVHEAGPGAGDPRPALAHAVGNGAASDAVGAPALASNATAEELPLV